MVSYDILQDLGRVQTDFRRVHLLDHPLVVERNLLVGRMRDAFHLQEVQVLKVVPARTVADAQTLTMVEQTAVAVVVVVVAGIVMTKLQSPGLEVAQTALAELVEVEQTAVEFHEGHQTAVMAEELESMTQMIGALAVVVAEVRVEEGRIVEEARRRSVVVPERSWKAAIEVEHYVAEEGQTDVVVAVATDHGVNELVKS